MLFVLPTNLDTDGRLWTIWKHSQCAEIETRAAPQKFLKLTDMTNLAGLADLRVPRSIESAPRRWRYQGGFDRANDSLAPETHIAGP